MTCLENSQEVIDRVAEEEGLNIRPSSIPETLEESAREQCETNLVE